MELDPQAIVNALTLQRNRAMDEAAQLAALLTAAQAKIAVLEAAKKEEKAND